MLVKKCDEGRIQENEDRERTAVEGIVGVVVYESTGEGGDEKCGGPGVNGVGATVVRVPFWGTGHASCRDGTEVCRLSVSLISLLAAIDDALVDESTAHAGGGDSGSKSGQRVLAGTGLDTRDG